MHDQLFDNQRHLESAHLQQLAETLGLDGRRFSEELKNHLYVPHIRQNAAEGRHLSVRATPTFYVNGTLCDVSFGLEQLERAVEKVFFWAEDSLRVLRRPLVKEATASRPKLSAQSVT
jgi:protein-disulfide isomerase